MTTGAARPRLLALLLAALLALVLAATVGPTAASAHSRHHHHKKHHAKKHHHKTTHSAATAAEQHHPRPISKPTSIPKPTTVPTPVSTAPTSSAAQLPLSADQRIYFGAMNSASMISTQSGNLVLSAARTSKGLLSSEVDSAPFTYGTVTVRAKLAKGTGMWPAIWLAKPIAVGPLGTPEIDMQELPQPRPGMTADGNFTYHWTDPSGTPWALGLGREMPFDLTTDFHTYKLVWMPGSITMWVDNLQVMHVESNPAKSTGIFRADAGMASEHETTRTANIPIYSGPMYLRINNGVGSPGSWGGSPDASTPFPNATIVSSVRIDPLNGTPMQATTGGFAVHL